MKKKTLVTMCIISLAIFIVLSGCSAKQQIVMVCDHENIQEDSWLKLISQGLLSYPEYYDVSYVIYDETVEFNKRGTIYWIASPRSHERMISIARENPDSTYIFVDAVLDLPSPNTANVYFRVEESAFLAGYVAAKSTETGKIGIVLGSENTQQNVELSFRNGAKYAVPDIELYSSFIGNFYDSSKAYQLANDMYQNKGCDVVMQFSGAAGIGAIDAAVDNDKWVIGADSDQTELAPNNVLTCVIKNIKEVTKLLLKDQMEGKPIAGKNYTYELSNMGTGLSRNNGNISNELYIEVSEVAQKITTNKIDIYR